VFLNKILTKMRLKRRALNKIGKNHQELEAPPSDLTF